MTPKIEVKPTSTKDICKSLIAIIIIFTAAILIFEYLASREPIPRDKKISLPEEIQLARPGDTLIVESVTNTINIGFKPKNIK